jgi:quinol monooxygenase YgiN
MVAKGLLVRLESRDETRNELEAFLISALPMAREEAGAIAWFAVHFGGTEYGIFDVFADETGRQAHLDGPIAKALMTQGSALLSKPPQIHRLDVLACKLPHTAPARADTKALLLTFEPKSGHEDRVHNFLREAQPWVEEEPGTTAWFSIRLEDGKFGIFDTFPDHAGRLRHLTGRVARELAAHALSLLGGIPDPELLDVLAEKL